jgi:hypothetical protein
LDCKLGFDIVGTLRVEMGQREVHVCPRTYFDGGCAGRCVVVRRAVIVMGKGWK